MPRQGPILPFAMAVRLTVLMFTFLKGHHSLTYFQESLLPLTCVGRPIRIDPHLARSWQKPKIQKIAAGIVAGTPRGPSG